MAPLVKISLLAAGSGRARRQVLAVVLVGVAILLAGCSDGGPSLPVATASGDRPTPSFSRSSPTTSEPTSEPTRSSEPEESSEPAPSKSKASESAAQDDEDSQQGSSGEDADASESAGAIAADSASDRDPSDVSWGWLLFAVLVAAAVGVPLFRRLRRRSSWTDQVEAATGEVAWFARELIPQLGQQTSVDLVAGGWHLSRARVVAAEDALTGLAATAPDAQGTGQARVLRDAVRQARAMLDAGTAPGAVTAIGVELAAAAGTLEAALAPPDLDQPPA